MIDGDEGMKKTNIGAWNETLKTLILGVPLEEQIAKAEQQLLLDDNVSTFAAAHSTSSSG